MLKSDPFLLSAAEMATTEAMRADGTIPQDWRYIDISWQHAAIFDKIVEIGGADMRVLDSSQRDEKKRGQIVFGTEASKRINERALEIRVLFKIAAYRAKADTMAIEVAA
ncbi:MAG: hypothetical protein ACLPSW_27445 [Roseiarcus sp.]